MTTELEKFTEAYATMVVATYEPIIMRWFSGWTLGLAASTMAWRQQKAGRIDLDRSLSTAHALMIKRLRPGPIAPPIAPVPLPQRPLYDIDDNVVPPGAITKLSIPTHPDAIQVENVVLASGGIELRNVATTTGAGAAGGGPSAAPTDATFTSDLIQTGPSYVNGRLGAMEPGFDFRATRATLLEKMVDAVSSFLSTGSGGGGEGLDAARAAAVTSSFEDLFFDALANVGGVKMYEFLPRGRLMEALSPIGLAHYYRQLYFNVREGVGPIEQAFTIAPLETLEVAYETVRRQIHEETLEVGTETVTETAEETRNLDEVSDKVSSMVQRDSTAAMSARGSGSIGVWQVGAEASASFAVSTQRAREETSKRLKEVTKRASERITKSFTLRTRDVQDVTTTSLTRRTIRNESPDPVSYGLRRVLRRVLVKVQDMGPRLVWQVYLRNPGNGLARSHFVHFREQGPIAVPDVPPGLRPRPVGGTDTGTTRLNRAVTSGWVFGPAANQHALAGENSPPMLPLLSTPPPTGGADPGLVARQSVLGALRPPSGYPPATGNGKMPKVLGDNALASGSSFLTVTPTQYAILERWVAGKFTRSGTSPPTTTGPGPAISPQGLDQAALERCVGGAFVPGIEVGWQIRAPGIFAGPFRIRHGAPSRHGGDPTTARVEAGYFSRQMAVPWQADFLQCAVENRTVTPGGTAEKFGWWPQQRPLDVLTVAGGTAVPWDRLSGGRSPSRAEMVAHWSKFGFVLRDPTGFLEKERSPGLP